MFIIYVILVSAFVLLPSSGSQAEGGLVGFFDHSRVRPRDRGRGRGLDSLGLALVVECGSRSCHLSAPGVGHVCGEE